MSKCIERSRPQPEIELRLVEGTLSDGSRVAQIQIVVYGDSESAVVEIVCDERAAAINKFAELHVLFSGGVVEVSLAVESDGPGGA